MADGTANEIKALARARLQIAAAPDLAALAAYESALRDAVASGTGAVMADPLNDTYAAVDLTAVWRARAEAEDQEHG
ncbi:hypothetical protein DWF04_006245 [Cereibacter sphaeroides f. sp. denitrificans]|nr:hypothetical protein DWF04_12805 [Cereibacter sphaeroides f. sp. denitrificans]